MDFVRYAESSAALLNAELTDRDSVVAHLAARAWLQPQVTDRDVVVLRRFQSDLRPGVRGLGAATTPRAWSTASTRCSSATRSRRGSPTTTRPDLHLHVANRAASVADLLVGESLLGPGQPGLRPRPDPARGLRGHPVHQRVRRHLAQPVAPLLLRALLLAGQRRGVPRPPEGCCGLIWSGGGFTA